MQQILEQVRRYSKIFDEALIMCQLHFLQQVEMLALLFSLFEGLIVSKTFCGICHSVLTVFSSAASKAIIFVN